MDAVPLTVGQEWSGWAQQVRDSVQSIRGSESGLFQLAAGGTAVGTGLNAPPGFGPDVAALIASATGYPFVTAPNKFAALAGSDALAAASAGLRGLAVPLGKVANDIRWLGSGPRAGLGELLRTAREAVAYGADPAVQLARLVAAHVANEAVNPLTSRVTAR